MQHRKIRNNTFLITGLLTWDPGSLIGETKLAISPAGFYAVNVAVVIEELSGRQSLGLVFGNDVTISEVIEMLLPTVPNSSSSARRLPGGATSDP